MANEAKPQSSIRPVIVSILSDNENYLLTISDGSSAAQQFAYCLRTMCAGRKMALALISESPRRSSLDIEQDYFFYGGCNKDGPM